MATRNYEAFLLGETVKTKKYFYAIRPLLAARWILDERAPAPCALTSLQRPSSMLPFPRS